jgi:hypothetical protein
MSFDSSRFIYRQIRAEVCTVKVRVLAVKQVIAAVTIELDLGDSWIWIGSDRDQIRTAFELLADAEISSKLA